MSKCAVLLGYGIFNRRNVEYRRYVDAFASFVKTNSIDTVVLSGGHTDPRRTDDSEASTIRDYIRPLLGRNVNVSLEQRSLTTAQNIRFSKRFVAAKNYSKIIIFCDNVRPAKVMWFTMHYWFGSTKSEIEQYFIDYSLHFYRKHFTTEKIGAEMEKGLTYKNVTIKPYRMRKKIEDAVANQIPSTLEINSLYDKALDQKLIKSIKIKFGLD
jgi:hypothetical protein